MTAEIIGSGGSLILAAALVFPIWAIVDVLSRSRQAFDAAGQSKAAWVVVLIGFIFIGLAPLLALYYLVWVRRKVKLAASG
jgi:Na+-driven multidrug efflux pump